MLSGPTSVVVLEPATEQWSSLVPALWDEVVGAASLVDLAAQLAGYRIDTMPSFAAFFWTKDGMRSLVRGAVRVLDPATGSVVADGAGIQTWSEVGLSGLTQVQVELPAARAETTGPSMSLPLVIGAVRASSLTLDASEQAQVFSPQELVAPAESFDDDSGRADNLADNAADKAEPDEPDEPAEPDNTGLDGPTTELMTDPFLDSDLATSAVPAQEWVRGVDGSSSMDPGLSDSIENGETQLMMPSVAAEPVASPTVSQDSMVMAVVCPDGHSSPQNATFCRVCGAPIASQGPRLVARPALAVLRASDGSTAEVDRAVLLGRAPSAHLSSARAPRLMTVPSPSHDISRTHVEIAPEDWQIVVTDLGSTNGTVLVRPGSGKRQQLPPGESVPVPLQSLLELGDGVAILIDFPQ